jgi:2-methylisocitrate lyase-like PEP mutase family enzyme
MDIKQKRRRFRELHQQGFFILPNPWDIGSARYLEKRGFQALASTSSGAALAVGRTDGELTRDEVIAHLRVLCAATSLPVNADFEAGFGDTPQEIAASVRMAIDAGVSGLSIEDARNRILLDKSEAVERLRAAREAIDRSGEDVILVGRAEGFLRGRPHLHDVIDRLTAYSENGADCLYAPGLRDLEQVRAVVAAVAPKPVNVLLLAPLCLSDLAEAGVRRVSTGGALARRAYTTLEQAADELLATQPVS